ncbi:MAG TPA: tetratricopeptide repeat protein [Candidatus Dormibacteraeota bacterium]|nr:tetratricopeptide repeat protein [Candidatus Dormibacteraeota bacterium]
MDGFAEMLKRERKFTDAIAEFQQVLASNPLNLKANFGGTLLQARRHEEAAVAFRRALILVPDEPDFHGNLGLAPQKAGDAAEAQKEFTLAEKLRGNKKK